MRLHERNRATGCCELSDTHAALVTLLATWVFEAAVVSVNNVIWDDVLANNISHTAHSFLKITLIIRPCLFCGCVDGV